MVDKNAPELKSPYENPILCLIMGLKFMFF